MKYRTIANHTSINKQNSDSERKRGAQNNMGSAAEKIGRSNTKHAAENLAENNLDHSFSRDLLHRLGAGRKAQLRIRRIAAPLAIVIVLLTVMQLIMPALSMTRAAQTLECSYRVHQHTDACYQNLLDENGKKLGEELICGQADWVVHTHTDDCYETVVYQADGNEIAEKVLVCDLPEIKAHKHDAGCYATEEKLICGEPEHTHGDACYTAEEKLTCGETEHTHSDACYTAEEKLTCGEAEHTHSDACFETEEVLICGESELHTHDASCYKKGHKDDVDYLICGKLALTEHIHGEGCFVDKADAEAHKTEAADEQDITAQSAAAADPAEAHKTEAADEQDITARSAETANSAEDRGKEDASEQGAAEQTAETEQAVEPAETAAEEPALSDPSDNLLSLQAAKAAELIPDQKIPAAKGVFALQAAAQQKNSLSVVSVSGNDRDLTDITVNAALVGTDRKTLNYNLYAYLLSSGRSEAYGAKIDFVNGTATATIKNVPVGEYKLYLAYNKNNNTLQERWTYSEVLNQNNNNWVDTDGGYIFGYSANMPASKTLSADDNTVSFQLEIPAVSNSVNVTTLMDRALKYGITADEISYKVPSYTNYAAKKIDSQNSNGGAEFGHRADGVDVIPNILGDVNNNGQLLSAKDKAANYYVTEDDQNKVSSSNTNDTIIRNHNELADRVEIMLSNTLKQCDTLASMSELTLPATTSVDVSAYPENATIILNADAINRERNGFLITKRPGQTIVFNINQSSDGQQVGPPDNIKVKLVDDKGDQIGDVRVAGGQMRNAPAADGDVWNKIVWNFPNAAKVTAGNDIGGIFLVPKGDFDVTVKGGGWIVARGKVAVNNEWYAFPGSDEPFKQKLIRKAFVGISNEEINPDYAIKVYTHTNESTSGTTMDELITTLVLKEANDPSLTKDAGGTNDQTGYLSTWTEDDGTVYYEWQTPPLSVGNEHKLTEKNAASQSGQSPDLIEFEGPYSVWSEEDRDYVWINRDFAFTSEAEMEGIFNISTHNDDYRQYAYITNYYNVEKNPHDLTLTKLVEDPEQMEEDGAQYRFEIALQTETGEALADQSLSFSLNHGTAQTVNIVDGTVTMTLAKNDTVTFFDLPYGAQYTVREQNIPAKCSVTFSGDSNGTAIASGKLIKDRAVTATNIYADDPGLPITAHKDLEGADLTDGQFTFRLMTADGRIVKEAHNDANGNIPFGTLVFEQDGEYDYHLYEVADETMTDILFDTTEYEVHLVVSGGRVREVTYANEKTGASSTTPMFRNRKIPTDSDKLTARKMFIDRTTGKAIELAGGEFSFTATANADSEEPLVYTGTNDADGMVTFVDETGAEVDLDALTEPTSFTIAETADVYNGTVESGKILSYDETTHATLAKVETSTVNVDPVTITKNGADSATADITFVPRETANLYYYYGTSVGAGSVEPRSDGSVTMTIGISKNQTGTDNAYRNIEVEYGIGNYYNDWATGEYKPHQKVGTIVIRAKGGPWNVGEIEVQSVKVDGNAIASSQHIEKTVELVYNEGAFPVFVNTLSAAEADTTDFSFTKVWVDNATYADPQAWEDGREITVTLSGSLHSVADGSVMRTQDYEFKIRRDPEAVQGFSFIQPAGESAVQIEPAAINNGDHHYGFVITGLPDSETVNDRDGLWRYVLKEADLSGYMIGYGSWNEAGQKAEPDQAIAQRGISDRGYLINASVSAELPEAGGPGTALFTIIGGMLVLAALTGLIVKRRMA